MLVHENLYGIMTMGTFLLFVLLYNLITFGQYSMMESAIICGASVCEITGVLYLLTLIKHKKQIRYVQHFETRFEKASISKGQGEQDPNASPQSNRQMPHHRKIGLVAPTTPSITISFTESDPDHNKEPNDILEEDEDVEPDYGGMRKSGSCLSVNSQQSVEFSESSGEQISENKTKRKHRHRPKLLTVPNDEQTGGDEDETGVGDNGAEVVDDEQRVVKHQDQPRPTRKHRKDRKRNQEATYSSEECYSGESYEQAKPNRTPHPRRRQDTRQYHDNVETDPRFREPEVREPELLEQAQQQTQAPYYEPYYGDDPNTYHYR